MVPDNSKFGSNRIKLRSCAETGVVPEDGCFDGLQGKSFAGTDVRFVGRVFTSKHRALRILSGNLPNCYRRRLSGDSFEDTSTVFIHTCSLGRRSTLEARKRNKTLQRNFHIVWHISIVMNLAQILQKEGW